MYNDPNCKPWTSRSWAPTGYSSRYDLVQQTKAAEERKPFSSGVVEEEQVENVELMVRVVDEGGAGTFGNEKNGMGNGVGADAGYAAGVQGKRGDCNTAESRYDSGTIETRDQSVSAVGDGAMASRHGTGFNEKWE